MCRKPVTRLLLYLMTLIAGMMSASCSTLGDDRIVAADKLPDSHARQRPASNAPVPVDTCDDFLYEQTNPQACLSKQQYKDMLNQRNK